MAGKFGRRLAPAAGVFAVLAFAAPAAMADTTGQINVEVSSSGTTGMVLTGNTWAPDGTSPAPILNATDLANSAVTAGAPVTVVTTAPSGTPSSDPGNIDLKADPSNPAANVTFAPAAGSGVVTVDTTGVTVSTAQFDGPVELASDVSFDTGGGATFQSTVDGAHSLTLGGDGGDFWGNVGSTSPPTSITASQVRIFNGSNVITAGPQDYEDDVELVSGSSVLTSTAPAATGDLTFGTIDGGGNGLTTEADGTTTFGGAITSIGSLTAQGRTSNSAGTTVINASSISTNNNGSVSFDNAVQLGTDVTLSASGGSATFASTVDSVDANTAGSLTSSDPVFFDGTVGGTTPLSSVNLNAVNIKGNVTTTGGQTYGLPVLQSSATLKSTNAGAIAFTGKLTGGTQFSLTTDTTGTTAIDKGLAGTDSGSGIAWLDINGPSTVAGTVHTSGDQTYGGEVIFGTTPVLIADSGDIDSTSPMDLGGANVSIRGSGSLSGVISDGSLTLGSGSASAGAPSYTLWLNGDNNTYAGGTTVTGTNSMAMFSSRASFGTGEVKLANNAGLKWAPGSSADISAALAQIPVDGAVFDTNGNNVTFATPLRQNGNVGPIVKRGAGALTLSGANTLEMPWDVKGGTLSVTGSLAGPVTVEAGAGFALSGQAGGHVTVNQSGALTCDGGTLGNGLTNNGTANYVPAAPTGVSAAVSGQAAAVSFAPGATRCSPFTGYEVTAEPGNIHASGTGSPIVVSGLKSGTAYTFTVTATNVIGTSVPSGASAPVSTPRLVNASISSPVAGRTYELGQKVTTTFSCTGVVSGALTSCKDSNGATGGTGALDTRTPGRHTYLVTATASDGSTTVASISYTVSVSNQLTLSKIAAHAGGLLTFTVKVPDAGSIRLLEKMGHVTLASATRFARGAKTLALRLTVSKHERRLLTNHSAKATLAITFTPVGGTPRTVKRSGLRLKR